MLTPKRLSSVLSIPKYILNITDMHFLWVLLSYYKYEVITIELNISWRAKITYHLDQSIVGLAKCMYWIIGQLFYIN